MGSARSVAQHGFGPSSAEIAAATLQRPIRVAIQPRLLSPPAPELTGDDVLIVDDSIAALTAVPVAMLPPASRRDSRPPGATELRVRIYPDQAHLDSHRRELTSTEVAAGRAYWRSRWTGNGEAAWLDLTRGTRPARAQWVVTANTPTNLDQLGDPAGPDFGEPAQKRRPRRRGRSVAALPQEWLVVGYQGGAEVVRVWSRPVARDLAVGLLGDSDFSDGTDDTDDTETPTTPTTPAPTTRPAPRRTATRHWVRPAPGRRTTTERSRPAWP